MKLHHYVVLLIGLLLVCANKAAAELTPTRLTCEYLSDPPVVDVLKPRLSWINIAEEGERGQLQTAWHARVASSKAGLEKPDLWDSKRIESNQSIQVRYGGVPLESRQECWWQVRVWDRDGRPSPWSRPARWRMGLLDPSDWKARWVGAPWQGEETLPKPRGGPDARPAVLPPPAPLLRKEFSIDREVTRAVAFVTGLGYFELYVNGKKVGDDEGIMFSQALGPNGKPLKWLNLGDWCAPKEMPPDNMVHTFYFWRCADLTAQTARALGRNGEARQYADPDQPGYRHIIFRPQPVDELSHASYSNRTPFGRAGIEWKREGSKFLMAVNVPVGGTATVYVPAKDPQSVAESGRTPETAEGVEYLRTEDEYAVFSVTSGEYLFQVEGD